jgi:choline dehydrogenase-like flavoprotein
VHPAAVVVGVYSDPIEGWIGQIQSALSDQFKRCEDEYGFLIEAVGMTPAVQAMSLPWVDGRQHKETIARIFKHSAPFISVARDHGEGRVVIDDHGRALTRWSFDDEVDARLFRRAMVELAKLHRAIEAREIVTFYQQPIVWREGDNFDAFLAEVERGSLAPNDVAAFTAHQMGSCRIGSDPADSVADGHGELHDVKGVWIGDGSAFPTAPGVNPMISIMSLAHRTAANIAAGSKRERREEV